MSIILHCDGCAREVLCARSIDTSLPWNVRTIRTSYCDKCDGGDFGEERWFDEAGRELSQDDRLFVKGAASAAGARSDETPLGGSGPQDRQSGGEAATPEPSAGDHP